MARRLPSSLSNCLRSCQLYRAGQTCYDCPNRGSTTCPIPDIEDLFKAKFGGSAPCAERIVRMRAPRSPAPAPDCSSVASPAYSAPIYEQRTPTPASTPSQEPIINSVNKILSRPTAQSISSIAASRVKLPMQQSSVKVGFRSLFATQGSRTAGTMSVAARMNIFASLTTSSVPVMASQAAKAEPQHFNLRDIPMLNQLLVERSLGSEIGNGSSRSSEQLVPLSSVEGKDLFTQALSSGGLENYFSLSEQYLTQMDPSISAVSSLAMVLNALNHDPKKTWKGPWRWNSEEVVQCEGACGHSLELFKRNGVSFAELVAMARCQGVRARPVSAGISHTGSDKLAQFRKDIMAVCGDAAAQNHMVVNFSRAALNQDEGDGHFSPVGGYNAEHDMVLILDVARYKSPPFWVSLPRLWSAMMTVDMKTGRTRGYVVLSSWSTVAPVPSGDDISLCPLMIRSWSEHTRGGNCCKGPRAANRRRDHRRQGRSGEHGVSHQSTASNAGAVLAAGACIGGHEGKLDMLIGRSRLMHSARPLQLA